MYMQLEADNLTPANVHSSTIHLLQANHAMTSDSSMHAVTDTM